MMPVTFVNSGGQASTTALRSSMSQSISGSGSGRVTVLIAAGRRTSGSGNPFSTPSGWTFLKSAGSSVNGTYVTAWYRTGSVSSVTISSSAGNIYCQCAYFVFSDFAASDFIEAGDAIVSAGVGTIPGITLPDGQDRYGLSAHSFWNVSTVSGGDYRTNRISTKNPNSTSETGIWMQPATDDGGVGPLPANGLSLGSGLTGFLIAVKDVAPATGPSFNRDGVDGASMASISGVGATEVAAVDGVSAIEQEWRKAA